MCGCNEQHVIEIIQGNLINIKMCYYKKLLVDYQVHDTIQ